MGKINSFELIEKVAEFCKDNNDVGYTEFFYENDNSYEKLSIIIDLIDCVNISIKMGEIQYNTPTSDKFTTFKYDTIEQLIEKLNELTKF